MNNETMTNYNGHEIIPVYDYSNGTSDFEVYKDGADKGTMYARTTLEKVKADIDASDDTVINHKLELSIATQFLMSRIDTALVMFEIDKDWQSDDDWNECVKILQFLSRVKGRDVYTGYRHKLEDHLEAKGYYK